MIRTIAIRPVLNGFVCHVGCQQICFTSREDLVDALTQYLECPAEIEGKFLKHAINPPEGPIDPRCIAPGIESEVGANVVTPGSPPQGVHLPAPVAMRPASD